MCKGVVYKYSVQGMYHWMCIFVDAYPQCTPTQIHTHTHTIHPHSPTPPIQDCKLKAVERMTACFTDTIDSALRLAGELMTEDPLLLVANLFYTRQTGGDWCVL